MGTSPSLTIRWLKNTCIPIFLSENSQLFRHLWNSALWISYWGEEVREGGSQALSFLEVILSGCQSDQLAFEPTVPTSKMWAMASSTENWLILGAKVNHLVQGSKWDLHPSPKLKIKPTHPSPQSFHPFSSQCCSDLWSSWPLALPQRLQQHHVCWRQYSRLLITWHPDCCF